MGKSVYSIVLDDDVIKMIDIMAVRQGTSRSNMINRILAQHISVPTAETMLNDIYSSIDSFLQGHNSLALSLMGNGSMINMRSALQYKYNPSVKYTLEIFERGDYLGQLKISVRSQKPQVLSIFEEFFIVWANLEMQYCDVKHNEFSIDTARYTRLIRLCSNCNYADYGNSIAIYTDILDRCLKEFFSLYSISPAAAKESVQQIYLANITNNISRL
ncbi:MAG: hypothetical protein E7484_00600 [Ruminococcaceae bacterium]|nr:hypothetical protein [Oscillospiraceae bacterium]